MDMIEPDDYFARLAKRHNLKPERLKVTDTLDAIAREIEAVKFRKKPVEIEAIQLDGTREAWEAAMAFSGMAVGAFNGHLRETDRGRCWFYIETLEGQMTAQNGDWIIKGVAGELYPCKPDIFAVTYEPATALSNQGEGAAYWISTSSLAKLEAGSNAIQANLYRDQPSKRYDVEHVKLYTSPVLAWSDDLPTSDHPATEAEADRRDAERFAALLSACRMLVESEPAHITPRNTKEREACKLIRAIVKESDK